VRVVESHIWSCIFSQAKWNAITLTMGIGGLEMTKKLRRAETAAERKAMAGSAQEFEFIWRNRDWSERFLEYVRLAAATNHTSPRSIP
jgi:hypothetical protein